MQLKLSMAYLSSPKVDTWWEASSQFCCCTGYLLTFAPSVALSVGIAATLFFCLMLQVLQGFEQLSTPAVANCHFEGPLLCKAICNTSKQFLFWPKEHSENWPRDEQPFYLPANSLGFLDLRCNWRKSTGHHQVQIVSIWTYLRFLCVSQSAFLVQYVSYPELVSYYVIYSVVFSPR